MSWPKGRPRPKKATGQTPSSEQEAMQAVELAEMVEIPREPNQPPDFWRKGELLNVRNRGEYYVITRHPDESDPRYPEREMRFTNLGECQAFVSAWYTAEHHDPRAR